MPPPTTTAVQQETIRVLVLVGRTPDRRVDDVIASARANLPSDDVALVDVATDDDAALPARVAAARVAANERDARGVFWLDLRDAREYRVYLYLPGSGTVLRRRVPEAAQSVEAAIEAMWLIVRSGTLALRNGADVAMERVDPAAIAAEAKPAPPPVAKPPSPPPPRPSSPSDEPGIGLRISASYLGLGIASAIPWQSGGRLEIAQRVHRFVELGMGYGAVAGMRTADLRLLRHELGAVAAIGGPLARRVRLSARVLPAVELVAWHAGDRKGLEVVPKLGLELALAIALIPRLRLDVAAGADAALRTFDFVQCAAASTSCSGADRKLIVAPWPAWPRARAGVTVLF